MTIEALVTHYLASNYFKNKMEIPATSKVDWRYLAQGEYNLNVVFTHPVSHKNYVLRMNFGSQMHLDHQLRYEYDALNFLLPTERTPSVCFIDDSHAIIEEDVLVMEFLSGHHLDYRTDISLAMEALADIHSLMIPKENHLVSPLHPLEAILDECREMFSHYENSSMAKSQVLIPVHRMLDYMTVKIQKLGNSSDAYKCIINTELNNTNFLINGTDKSNYIIDWEKPIYGSPAQDLGHFFAPTTTFWKTDIFLKPEIIERNIDYYIKRVANRFPTKYIKDEIKTYIEATCMRGITWCAMAFVEYNSDQKKLTNESTRIKLDQYLSQQFLDTIENSYLI